MAIKERLDHAKHNETVCKHLDKKGFCDWVITTAFYSSYHYLLDKIFPLKLIEGKKHIELASFEEYCLYKGNGGLKQNHQIFKKLVTQEASNISAAYSQLLDMSQNSRYADYKCTRKLSDHAKMLLGKIKNFCGH